MYIFHSQQYNRRRLDKKIIKITVLFVGGGHLSERSKEIFSGAIVMDNFLKIATGTFLMSLAHECQKCHGHFFCAKFVKATFPKIGTAKMENTG